MSPMSRPYSLLRPKGVWLSLVEPTAESSADWFDERAQRARASVPSGTVSTRSRLVARTARAAIEKIAPLLLWYGERRGELVQRAAAMDDARRPRSFRIEKPEQPTRWAERLLGEIRALRRRRNQ